MWTCEYFDYFYFINSDLYITVVIATYLYHYIFHLFIDDNNFIYSFIFYLFLSLQCDHDLPVGKKHIAPIIGH